MAHEFDLVRSVYTSCASFCFTLGMLFNAFLVWLILTKTPAPMLVYSKLLMTPCMMDIFLCLFTFLVQPIPIVDHGYHAVVQNGFFRQMSELYNYTANVIWFQVLLLSVCATTVQFVFRYYMIFNDGHIPARLKYLTGTVLAALLFAHVMLHYLSDYPFAKYSAEMKQLAIWVHEEVGITDIRFSSFTPARSYLWILHCIAMLVIFGICYVVIVGCARGTCNYIAKAYENATTVGNGDGAAATAGRADMKKNEKMREYNNQITTAMIVQAILPTVEVLELTIQVTLPIFVVQGGTVYFMVYAAIPLYFIPVMNPLATMLFVKPYRKAVLKLIRKKLGRRQSNVPVRAFQGQGGVATKTAFTNKMIAHQQMRMPAGTDGTTEESSSTPGAIDRNINQRTPDYEELKQEAPDQQNPDSEEQLRHGPAENSVKLEELAAAADHRQNVTDQQRTADILHLNLDQHNAITAQQNMALNRLQHWPENAAMQTFNHQAYAANTCLETAPDMQSSSNKTISPTISETDQQTSAF
uniref:G protein-coupled receptor n=1 Tax=Globodera rostochiensis TaxID=31243 RepID=A0A914HGV9_GLORO